MSLRDKQFEAAIRRRVRAAVQQSPSLRREYRRARRTSQPDLSLLVFRAMCTGALLISMSKLSAKGASTDALLGLLTIWCTCFAIHYANRLRLHLYASNQLLVMALQPMADSAIFAHQWRGFIGATLGLLIDALAALALIFSHVNAGLIQWITTIPCALALWMSSVSLAALFVWRRPAANYTAFSTALFLLVVTVVIAGVFRPELAARALEGASGPFYMLPPFGWINYVTRDAVLGSALWPLLLLVPIAFLAPGLHHARKRIAEQYELIPTDPPESVEPEPEPTVTATGSASPIPPPAGAVDPAWKHEITAAWQSPAPTLKFSGWMERLIGRWLTPRECDIADFMTAGQMNWTAALRRSVVLTGAALLAAAALGPAGLWVCYVGLYLALSTGLPLMGTACVGFSAVNLSGASFAVYASLPLGYREIGRFLFKVNAVRILAFLPAALVAGAVVGEVAQFGWISGTGIAAKIIALVLAGQPVIVTAQFSAATNDTRGSAWRSIKLIAAFAPIFLGLAGASLATFFVGNPLLAAGCLAAAAVFSWCAYLLYGRFYHRNAFDLMHGQAQ